MTKEKKNRGFARLEAFIANVKERLANVTLRKLTVILSRVVMGSVLTYKGFFDAIDPIGTSYKAEQYLQCLGLNGFESLAYVLAVVVSAIRLMIGVSLIFGVRISVTAIYLMIFLISEAAISVVAFGEVFHAGRTAGWDAFFFLLGILVFVWRDFNVKIFTQRTEWILSIYTFLYAIALSLHCYFTLPIIDPTEAKVECSLYDAMAIEAEKESISLSSELNDRLSTPGYSFALLSADISEASTVNRAKLNTLYRYAKDHGYAFTCFTPTDTDSQEIEEYIIESAGAEYSFVHAPRGVVRSVARSNPQLYILLDGHVISKYGCYHTPTITEPLDTDPHGEIKQENVRYTLLKCLSTFCIPLAFILLYDYIVELIKVTYRYYRRKRHSKSLPTPPDTEPKAETEDTKPEAETNDEINEQNILTNKNLSKMRKKIVAGNWKMNTTLQEGIALANDLKNALAGKAPKCDVVVCTPYISVAAVAETVKGTVIGVGAEDCSANEKGAFTGEVSASMVASTGAKYCILGHSERRQYHGEDNALLIKKLQMALANGLTPIFCVGEVKEERESDTFKSVIEGQMAAVYTLSAADFAKCVIAYEPVWAIGTGLTASSAQAQEVHAFIRASIAAKYDKATADNTSILYGGSCKGSNAPELFAQPDIDGGLIGGAALKAADFMQIIEAWK